MSEDSPEAKTASFDEHIEFVREIDDASRVGYSILGVSVVLVSLVVVLVSGVTLLSMQAVGLLLLSLIVTMLLGRFLGLKRHDEHLRERVRAYCTEREFEVEDLTGGVVGVGRFEFFAKLFITIGDNRE